MTDQDILIQAYLRGHAWRPGKEFENLHNITDVGRVLKMNADEADAKLLIRSLQLSDANYDPLVQMWHRRSPEYDGEIGNATVDLVKIPRCPIPDFAPPPNAAFDYGDPDLNGAVESYQRFAAEGYVGGTGSWPKGCDPEWPNVHSVVTLMDTSGAHADQKAILADALKLVEACEEQIGQHVRHIIPPMTYDGVPEHVITFAPIPGSVIGYNYFPIAGRCKQRLVGKIDSTFRVNAITLANLLTHEYKGHGDGLEHTRGGIMNPSIIVINPLSWIGDKHESTKRRYFGGIPIPKKPTDPPVPPPTVPGRIIDTIEIEGKRYDIVERGNAPVPPVIRV